MPLEDLSLVGTLSLFAASWLPQRIQFCCTMIFLPWSQSTRYWNSDLQDKWNLFCSKLWMSGFCLGHMKLTSVLRFTVFAVARSPSCHYPAPPVLTLTLWFTAKLLSVVETPELLLRGPRISWSPSHICSLTQEPFLFSRKDDVKTVSISSTPNTDILPVKSFFFY